MRSRRLDTRLCAAIRRFSRLTLALACAFAVIACESEAERQVKEERRDTARKVAVLLDKRECNNCVMLRVELPGRDLSGVRLHESALVGNLRGVNLRDAVLNDVSLGGDLRDADFRGATTLDLSLTGSTLAGARLDGLDLRTVKWADDPDWSFAVLRGANLQGVRFNGFRGASGRPDPSHPLDVPTGGAVMRGVDLRDANLSEARLSMVDLSEADLRGANLRLADLPPIQNIVGAQFEGATAPDGSTCLPGSVGRCITSRGAQPPWREGHRPRPR